MDFRQLSYEQGMFSSEALGDDVFFTANTEMEAVCYHEAAHAVSWYVFGKSLRFIGVDTSYLTEADGSVSVIFSGEVTRIHRSQMVWIDYRYRPMLFFEGVASAAGPVGELRFRQERGTPLRLIGGSEGDHLAIDQIGKCLEKRARDRFAYRRHVWAHAKRLLACETVWRAISDVAEELYASSDNTDGWRSIKPREVYRICRRHGLRQGIARGTKQ
ncbi:hypothetical protein J2X43_006279 [Rhizobium sp. BE258]|nr:hypothetical protein [Rhizobium sp. BE258]